MGTFSAVAAVSSDPGRRPRPSQAVPCRVEVDDDRLRLTTLTGRPLLQVARDRVAAAPALAGSGAGTVLRVDDVLLRVDFSLARGASGLRGLPRRVRARVALVRAARRRRQLLAALAGP